MAWMAVKVGDKLRNNDPRENGTVVEVTAVTVSSAAYKKGQRVYWIAFDRIYSDGKKRAQGYNLVAGA